MHFFGHVLLAYLSYIEMINDGANKVSAIYVDHSTTDQYSKHILSNKSSLGN